jgi:hypothetical protein
MEKINSTEKEILSLEATKKKLLRGILIFWLLSTVFLFLRIILEAFGSDPKSLFAACIYFLSGLFLLPFWGIFPNYQDTIQAGKPTFDAPAAVAIFCYTILVILALSVTWIVIKNIKTGKQIDKIKSENKPLDPTKSESVIK